MEFDCGQKGLLKLNRYRGCIDQNLDLNEDEDQMTGKLCFTFNDKAHEIIFEYKENENYAEKLALKGLKKCHPDANITSMSFSRSSHGVLSLSDETNSYQSKITASQIARGRLKNKALHNCLGCVSAYFRGEKKEGRSFNF